MNTRSFVRISTFLLVLASSNALAQIESAPGYIVTLKGDTLRGFIDIRSKSSDYKECYFRKDQNERSAVYTSNDIVAFGIDYLKYYEINTIKNAEGKDQKVFASIVISGRATLLRYQRNLYLRHDSLGINSLYFNTIHDLVGMNKVRGIMNYAMSDCKSLNIKWETEVLTDDRIAQLVRQYNACKKSHSKVPSAKSLPALKINTNLLFGVNIMTLQMSSFQTTSGTIALKETKFETNTSPIIGASFGLTFPRLNGNFSLYLEGSYFKSDITGHSSVMGVSYPETVNLNFKADYLKLAYGVRALFPARKFTPFAKAGVSNYIASNFSNVYTHVVNVNGNPVTQVSSPWTSGNQLGFWLGAGIQKRLTGKLALSFEARYDRTAGYDGPYPAYPINGSHTTILLGLGF